jgi:hypothetical protein
MITWLDFIYEALASVVGAGSSVQPTRKFDPHRAFLPCRIQGLAQGGKPKPEWSSRQLGFDFYYGSVRV